MGLLDDLAGQVLGGGANSGLGGGLGDALGGMLGGAAKAGPQTADIAQEVLGMLHGSGGLGGLAQIFQQKGLGNLMNQWVSTGPNPPMTPDQAHDVFGTAKIGEIAKRLGINPAMAAAAIAALLPTIIDHLTPHGKIPEQQAGGQQAGMGSLIEQGLGMLRGSGLLG